MVSRYFELAFAVASSDCCERIADAIELTVPSRDDVSPDVNDVDAIEKVDWDAILKDLGGEGNGDAFGVDLGDNLGGDFGRVLGDMAFGSTAWGCCDTRAATRGRARPEIQLVAMMDLCAFCMPSFARPNVRSGITVGELLLDSKLFSL